MKDIVSFGELTKNILGGNWVDNKEDWQRVFATWPRWSSVSGELIWFKHGWRLVTTEDDSDEPTEVAYNYIVLWLTEQEYTWQVLKQ